MSAAPRALLSAISLLLLSGQMASSDALSDLADRCLAEVAAGNIPAFEETAEAIKKRKDVFNTDARERAEDCLSQGYGEPWEYWFPSSSFEPTAAIAARIRAVEEAKAAERAAEAQAAIDAAKAEVERSGNAAKVAQLVYASCTTLLRDDEVAAMTNQLCVESFLSNGLPSP